MMILTDENTDVFVIITVNGSVLSEAIFAIVFFSNHRHHP